MSTRDLIDALVAGDSIAIENNFNAVMTDKISNELDDYRVYVAHNMFTPRSSEDVTSTTEE
jgi:hypothetical protein